MGLTIVKYNQIFNWNWKKMTEIYVEHVETYQGDCPCIFGKHPMFSNYV